MQQEWNRSLRRATLILTPFVIAVLITWQQVERALASGQSRATDVMWGVCYLLVFITWALIGRQRADQSRVPLLTLIGLLIVQTNVLIVLALSANEGYNIRLFGVGLTIFGAAVCLPWSWKYTTALTAFTIVGFTVDALVRQQGAHDFHFALFYLVSTASLSLASQFYQNRISWQEFCTRISAARARKEAETAREQNLQLKADLERLTREDPLTGVANRRGLTEFVERGISQAAGAHTQLGLIMLDIDHFKKLNDTYGHQAGDEVLRTIAHSLQQHLRPQDMLARYGGEEFVVVLSDITGAQLHNLGERIRHDAQQPLPEQTSSSPQRYADFVTLSAGAVMYPANGSNPDELIAVADEALYEAKNSGRDRCVMAAGGRRAKPQPQQSLATAPARTPQSEPCAPPTPAGPPVNLNAYNEAITPQFRIFTLWAAIIGFIVIGYWIFSEYFLRYSQFTQFRWIRLGVEAYLLLGWAMVKFNRYPYRPLMLWSFSGLCVIQAQIAWTIPRLGETLTATLLALAVTIYACAISMPWHWRYSLHLVMCTAGMIVVSNFTVQSGLSRNEILQVAFFLLASGLFSVFGHYIRFRTSWDEFVAKRSIEKATAEANAQRQSNTDIVAQLARLTREDALTKVANRRAFTEYLDIQLAGSHHDGRCFGLVMIDIDHFKKLNDTYGHQMGDVALYYVAQGLKSRLEEDDFIARYGGEEFVVVLPHAGPADLAEHAEHIRQNIGAAIPEDVSIDRDILLGVTLSAGAALYPTHGDNADDLIQTADSCLYIAKTLGRNRTECAPVPHVPQPRPEQAETTSLLQ